MTGAIGRVPAEAFFLPVAHGSEAGSRFCLYHAPHPDKPVRGAFLYIHPFAEEMNRSRRMAALQARRFADAGYGVLAIDLLGCGDSTGDFGDASWPLWKADLAVAKQWLEERVSTRIGLWGLRLGALLALDFAHSMPAEFTSLILWNPVVNGKTFMTQFLRLRLGSDVLADTPADGQKTVGTQALREALLAGEILEIAGYRIAPALALAIDGLHAETLAIGKLPIHWFEVLRTADGATDSAARLSPASSAIADKWCLQNVDLHTHAVTGLPFWATPELSICPALLDMTTAVADAGIHVGVPPVLPR